MAILTKEGLRHLDDSEVEKLVANVNEWLESATNI